MGSKTKTIGFIIIAFVVLYFIRTNYKDYNLKRTIAACIVAQKQTSKSFNVEEAKIFCEKKIKQDLKFQD